MKKYILGKYLFLFLVLGFIPSMAHAASIYFETSRDTVSVGDTFIVSAKIDAQNTPINTVDGSVVLDNNDGNVVVNDFSLAKSVFSAWPSTPSLSTDGNTISFVGGVPGGFNFDKAIIFNFILEADKEGEITISPKDMAVFANDGKATRVPTDFKSLTIKVLPKNDSVAPENDWLNLVTSDKTSPEPFTILVGKDPSLSGGKRFAFFTAVDNQSGISYYEVSEDGRPPVRSGSTYVLQNQNDKVTPNLVVTAYDKAGNKTVAVYKKPVATLFGLSLKLIIAILVVIIILFFIFRRIIKVKKMRRIKNNVGNNQ
jgi:hypothetical protein